MNTSSYILANEKTFDIALELCLMYEGGYVNNPNDLGGATNFGITQKTYNAYRQKKNLMIRSVKNITPNEVEDCYRTNYWFLSRCELLPPKLAICHFDWAVNSGVKRAIQTMQLVCGSSADGIFGDMTKNDVKAFLTLHGEKALCDAYFNRRNSFYKSWGKGRQAEFLDGWMNRSNHLKAYLRNESGLA